MDEHDHPVNEPIARGRTAEIHALRPGWVVKVYGEEHGREKAARERRSLAWAADQGVSVPCVGRVVCRQGRYGLSMARVEGRNGMNVILAGGVDVAEEAVKIAMLQMSVNRAPGGRLPDRREFLKSRCECCDDLTAPEKKALVGLLSDLPDGDRLIHGDFHPGNVIWSPAGPVIIDWVDACRGDPVSDVARSLVLFGAPVPGEPPADEARAIFTKTYLDAYQRLTGNPLERLSEWVLVTSAARMADGAAQGDVDLRRRVHEVIHARLI
jgi:tRNA A-37 threonylcarbamoyl transferase component Bud32